MNQNFLINICIFLTILILSPASAQRPETLRYNGNSYQVAEVVEVKGSNATLRTTNNKLITVPIRFLGSKLKVKAENIAKKSKLSGEGNKQTSLSVITANASDTDKALQQSIVEGTPLKRWVNGTVSNEQAEEGLLVVSSVTALDIKLDRDGVPLPPKKVKGSAIFINGLVMIEGAGKKAENTHVEYMAWDTGETIEFRNETIPKLTLKKTDPRPLVDERTWTNTDGKTLIALLASVIDTVGNFEGNDGKVFKYPIEKLSEKDQSLIKETIEKRYRELRSTL
jgi:hypothetical protein